MRAFEFQKRLILVFNQNLNVFANFYRTEQYRALSCAVAGTCEKRDTANITLSFFVSFLQEGVKKAFLLQLCIAILTR